MRTSCPTPALPERSSGDAGFSQSLERGLAILSAFKPGRPLLGSSELAREIGLSRSTAHRYVASLAMLGYLQQDPLTRKYRLGPRVLDLGFSAINSMEIREISAPYLQQLSDETGHTVNMAILDGSDIVYVERCRSSRQGQRDIDLNLHVGSRLPAYCTSMGKVLLAFMGDEERTALLDQIELAPRGPNTLTGARCRPSSRACANPGWPSTTRSWPTACARSPRRCTRRAARWRRPSTSPRTVRWSPWKISSRASAQPSNARPSKILGTPSALDRWAMAAGEVAAQRPAIAAVRPQRRATLTEPVIFVLSIAASLALWEVISRTGAISQNDLPAMSTSFEARSGRIDPDESTSGGRSGDTVRGWALGLGIATAARRPDRNPRSARAISPPAAFRIPVEFLRADPLGRAHPRCSSSRSART